MRCAGRRFRSTFGSTVSPARGFTSSCARRERRLMTIRCVISDFGGVLTTPLMRSFAAFQDQTGIQPEALGTAMQRIAEADGEHPLFELEKGRVSEADFLERLRSELRADLGHEPEMHG